MKSGDKVKVVYNAIWDMDVGGYVGATGTVLDIPNQNPMSDVRCTIPVRIEDAFFLDGRGPKILMFAPNELELIDNA